MLFSIFLHFHICSSDATKLDESSNNSSYLVFTEPNVYSFILPPGRYKITCYGAQGGWSHCGGSYGNAGGKGALVSGYINVTEKDQMFFAIVGGMGGSSPKGSSGGGYNGGGFGGWCKKFKRGLRKKQRRNGPGGGGGSTEIRFTTNDLSNRIIVAAGGSGASYNIQGAPGGNLTGFNSNGPSDRTTQTSGNENGIGSGGNNAKWFPSSGAGGGYRGGSGGYASDSNAAIAVSDSGSSYISGFPGCSNHPEILLDSGEMQIGVKEGNGYIQIDQEYKCPPNCTSCSGPFQCKICDSHYVCMMECAIHHALSEALIELLIAKNVILHAKVALKYQPIVPVVMMIIIFTMKNVLKHVLMEHWNTIKSVKKVVRLELIQKAKFVMNATFHVKNV